MFLIWGSRWRKGHSKKIWYECIICQEKNLSSYFMRNWFTFFFIPIFPISGKKFYLECPNCDNCYTLKKEINIEEFLNQHEIQEAETNQTEE